MSDTMTTWRELISDAMSYRGETWDDVEASVGAESFDVVFDAGYGGEEGKPFTVWTAKRVYFPACYDGSEWCASVSRVPDGKATKHIGG